MILALGKFSSRSVLNAAIAMGEGILADHDNPLRRHPNGWGAVWKDSSSPSGLSVYRDTRPIGESLETARIGEIETNFLAVHARHATLSRNQGIEYTHPVTREGTAVPWYLLHNGFLPTIYRYLGRDRSRFDSGEYFDFLVPSEGARLSDPEGILAKLEALEPGGNSANAIVINPRRAYVIHWFPENTPYPEYFTMRRAETEKAVFIASESIPFLADRWLPLTRGRVLEFEF